MKVSDLENARKYVGRMASLSRSLGVIERERKNDQPVKVQTISGDIISLTGEARRMVLMMAEAHIHDKLNECRGELEKMGIDLEGEKA